jgi:hypothetical protein
MNTKYYKEIEQMIVSARNMNEADFDLMADKCLAGISEEDRDEFCKALAVFHVDRIHQYMDVNRELAMLKHTKKKKETATLN